MNVAVARKLHAQYAGAIYHIMVGGSDRRNAPIGSRPASIAPRLRKARAFLRLPPFAFNHPSGRYKYIAINLMGDPVSVQNF